MGRLVRWLGKSRSGLYQAVHDKTGLPVSGAVANGRQSGDNARRCEWRLGNVRSHLCEGVVDGVGDRGGGADGSAFAYAFVSGRA